MYDIYITETDEPGTFNIEYGPDQETGSVRPYLKDFRGSAAEAFDQLGAIDARDTPRVFLSGEIIDLDSALDFFEPEAI